ncbi:aromatic compound dioxygenase [Phellopilus nigrolimitatus]|nr:aromatic compound dioxygenase [Phellopilus nigrolimitatus]
MTETSPPRVQLELPPHIPVSNWTLSKSVIRLLGTLCTSENPLLWSVWLGRRNKQADVEGPYYVLGAPDRQIEEGKGVLASSTSLKVQHTPFLMTVRVISHSGAPVPNAVLDWWQADTEGNYYFADYTLRGRVTTDSDGCAEVLTVVPGMYGSPHFRRAGHFHVWVHAPTKREGDIAWDDLTTQLYVCEANDSHALESDIANYYRKPRLGNMVHAWNVPTGSDSSLNGENAVKTYMSLPPLAADDMATFKRVEWWNTQLADHGLKIVCGANVEIRLSEKVGWL